MIISTSNDLTRKSLSISFSVYTYLQILKKSVELFTGLVIYRKYKFLGNFFLRLVTSFHLSEVYFLYRGFQVSLDLKSILHTSTGRNW